MTGVDSTPLGALEAVLTRHGGGSRFPHKLIKYMRFAKVGEEVMIRQNELTGAELRLYLVILFLTGSDGRCRNSIAHICGTYAMSYYPVVRHLKTLRGKGWLEDSKIIRPLIGLNDSTRG
jgi:hypothetical protein